MGAMRTQSRTGLVAMLFAVEILIVGFAVFSLRGSNFGSIGDMHHVQYAAQPLAPVAVGIAPNVTIDDVDSKVVVTTSNDAFVHVTDDTHVDGMIFGADHAQVLTVSRTFDGVRIYRPEGHTMMFGDSTNRIEVAVPAMTHLTILKSGGAEITGLRNGVSVTSQDGRIYLTDITGNITAHSDSGRVVASNVSANVVDLSSNDGRIETSQLELTGFAPRATLHTDDGPLVISGVFPNAGKYDLSTNDGHVDLSLRSGSDATIDASTGDGHVTVNGQSYGDGGNSSRTVRVGSGGSTLQVRTSDGSIHISTNGALING